MPKELTKLFWGLLLAFLIAWMIAPPLSYGSVYRVAAIGCYGLIIVYQMLVGTGGFRVTAIGGAFVILYIMIVSLTTGEAVTKRLGVYILILTALCAWFILSSGSPDAFFWLVPFAFLLFIIFNLTTLREIAVNPNIMRLLAKNTDSGSSYAARGIGGYSYAYTVVLALPLGFDLLLQKKEKFLNRILALGFLVTSYILIMQSAYLMAILLSILVIPIYIVLKIRHSTARILLLFLLLILLAAVIVNIEDIANYAIERIQINSIQRKLQDAVDMLQNDMDIGDSEFGTRYQRYSKDFRLIQENPITGTLDNDGNHSFILDTAARYGIPFALAMFTVLTGSFLAFRSSRSPAAIGVLLLAVCVLVFNTAVFSFGAVLYLLVPAYTGKYKKER